MTTTNQEVYDAYKEAGVSDETARAAAAQIPDKDEVATKADLQKLETNFQSAMKDMEIRLIWSIVAMNGLTIAILKLIL